RFAEGVEEISDLRPGMTLEGVVSNVTAFGAFVDIGVHQDGLVHISELSDSFVKDPAAVVRVGQIVKVRVLDVDAERRRIALSMKQRPAGASSATGAARGRRPSSPQRGRPEGSMAEAFRKVLQKRG
ncbi:MAG: S1 RNA-binding domain-containing protein, partial [Mesosutterella sp.]|nr:S1 RNA-binding domain-containing protein [Mesosutterella sp.]